MTGPNKAALEALGIGLPVIQAPMAGNDTAELAAAVTSAGGLGSLACALLTPPQIASAVEIIRQQTKGPVNLNFFCHAMAAPDEAAEAAWRKRLAPYYAELGLDAEKIETPPLRRSFDEAACALVEDLKPEVVSFHFGLPDDALLARVKRTGAKVLSSATSVAEARWLVARGCDLIIAQGIEAGGHRAMFLEADPARQVGTMALVPQIVDAVDVPVIAAGGIADARGIVAALALGASAVQLGTAFLFCPEAKVSPLYRAALVDAGTRATVVTNVFSGRPARGFANRIVEEVGPLSADAPAFPYAATQIAPLRVASEKAGLHDFMQMWAGEAVALGRPEPAGALTRRLAAEAQALCARLAG